MAKPAPSYNARRYRGLLYQHINERLARSGRWIVYIRADRRFKCNCFDGNAGGAASDTSTICPECFGLGYKVSIERIRAGFSYNQSLTPQANDSGIGSQTTFPATLTTRALTYPAQLDLVFEVEWSVPANAVAINGAPTRVLSAWRIRKVLPIYTELGELEFWGAGLEEHSLKLEDMEIFLRGAGTRITTTAALEDMTPGQGKPITWTPGGAGLGDRYTQFDSPDSYRDLVNKGLGRVARKPRPGL